MSLFTQFAPNSIKLIQRGVINITAGNSSNTATITSVDTTKSLLTYLGGNAGTAADAAARIDLTNATTITANRTGSTGFGSYGYEIVEYY